jgi:hypothetical protein
MAGAAMLSRWRLQEQINESGWKGGGGRGDVGGRNVVVLGGGGGQHD